MSVLLKWASRRSVLRGMTVRSTFLGVSLPQDLQRRRRVDRRFAHGDQVAEEGKVRVEVLPHFLKRLPQLDQAVQLEVSG